MRQGLACSPGIGTTLVSPIADKSFLKSNDFHAP